MLAEITDLEAALGRSIETSEVARAQRELTYASSLAGRLAPWNSELWINGAPEDVKIVVAGLAARRFVARTDGLVAIGPFRYAESDRSLTSTFTPDELGMLGLFDMSDTFDISQPDE